MCFYAVHLFFCVFVYFWFPRNFVIFKIFDIFNRRLGFQKNTRYTGTGIYKYYKKNFCLFYTDILVKLLTSNGQQG